MASTPATIGKTVIQADASAAHKWSTTPVGELWPFLRGKKGGKMNILSHRPDKGMGQHSGGAVEEARGSWLQPMLTEPWFLPAMCHYVGHCYIHWVSTEILICVSIKMAKLCSFFTNSTKSINSTQSRNHLSIG